MPKYKYKKNIFKPHIFTPDEYKKITTADDGLFTAAKIMSAKWQGKSVAIKRYYIDREDDNDYLRHEFARERAILDLSSRGKPRHLLSYYGYGHINGPQSFDFVVMPLVAQGDLYDFISDQKFKNTLWGIRLEMMTGLVAGVRFLHERDYMHADIKSPNVLVGDENQLVLCDFGEAHKSTECIGVSGTYMWCAPEMFNNDPEPTFASDVFSTAVVLWELGAWSVPTQDFVAHESQDNQHDMLKNLRDDSPPKVAALITWGWKQKPEERPTIQQVADELTQLRLK